jgi:hypothetical protein
MQNPIELFTSRGTLRSVADLEPEVAALNDPTVTQNFIALKAAIEAAAQDDAAVEAADASIATCIKQIAAGEAYFKEHYAPPSQVSEAKHVIASHRQ